jgi:hypothetical protein
MISSWCLLLCLILAPRFDEYDLSDNAELRISPLTNIITRNFALNFNFHGPACGSQAIDLDDESSQFNISSNVLVYGGIKNFDGMDRSSFDNLILYPTYGNSWCYAALQSTRNLSSAHSHFFDNHCVMNDTRHPYPYRCGAGPAPFYNKTHHVDVHDNTFSYPGAAAEPGWETACTRCWPKANAGPCPYKTFADWQADGHDTGSKIQLDLSNAQIIAEARAKLFV